MSKVTKNIVTQLSPPAGFLTTRAWHLKSRPTGLPTLDNFELLPLVLPPLEEGMIRVQNSWLSVDPYMRERMNDVKSYIPAFELGAPLEGGAVGQVVESRSSRHAVGDTVVHFHGWRETAVGPAAEFEKVPAIATPVSDGQWLANLGLTGSTAYFGLLHVAGAKKGDTLFVSAAAGAVGSVVVQIAKARGLTVIASAGGSAKCAWVRALGADEVLDYKAGPIAESLAQAAPDGIDIYFDNVGGDHLDAALLAARDHARFAMCGMIEGYNADSSTSLRHILRVVNSRLTLKGFIATDFAAQMPEFYRDMGAWFASGQVQPHETVRDGIEAAPQAFLDLFSGGNTGKMLVRL